MRKNKTQIINPLEDYSNYGEKPTSDWKYSLDFWESDVNNHNIQIRDVKNDIKEMKKIIKKGIFPNQPKEDMISILKEKEEFLISVTNMRDRKYLKLVEAQGELNDK